MNRYVKSAACLSTLFVLCGGAHAQSQTVQKTPQQIGAPPEASNMKLVGSNDLQARSAYQPTIHHQGERWIAYIGHHGGTDEVPDPVNPTTGKAGKYEGGGAQMVRVCDGKGLPNADKNAVYMLRTFGSEAHEIWNTADP